MDQLILTPPAVALLAPSPSPPGLAAPHAAAAADLAAANRAANVRALSLTQPALPDAVGPAPAGLTWTFARDGSLTAFDGEGRWWHGCSVPLAAARAMLKTLDAQGRVACFLRPTLGAHVRVALDTLRADQAVVCVNPDPADVGVLLHCGDFSSDIAAGRLWFACGGQWADELAALFEANPGLATPSQFVRLPLTAADEVERLVPAAQQVIVAANAARAEAMTAVRNGWRPAAGRRRVCVLAPSHFRLWDNAGAALARAMESSAEAAGVEVVPFDPDGPRSASALALARAAAGCDAIVAADVARGDLPQAAPADMPWFTWVTTPRIPAAAAAGPRDAVILADAAWRRAAEEAGWAADRVHVAAWPRATPDALSGRSDGGLAIVADTRLTQPLERLSEYSSHLLLWERLRSDLARDPFAVGDDPHAFLESALRRFDVGGEGLDRRLFIDGLIVPSYQQGVARLLLREKLPLRLFGAGWDQTDEFRDHAAGPVRSDQDLRRIAREAGALIHIWPGGFAHPVDSLGPPVVRARGGGRGFVSDALRLLAGQHQPRANIPPISASFVARLLETAGLCTGFVGRPAQLGPPKSGG